MQEKRYSIFPIKEQGLWERFKASEKDIWKAQEVDFSNDEFDLLEDSQKNYLKMLLLFFANSDSVVADNLVLNFMKEDIPDEAMFFYGYQFHNENVHNETYATIIDSYITDTKEKLDAFNSIETSPVVSAKMKWAIQWLDKGSFSEKMVAFSVVEVLLFSSTFAGIFGFKSMGKKLEGLYVANEWISRDEIGHGQFAVYFYNNYLNNLDKDVIKEIIMGGYVTEEKFVNSCFEDGVVGFSEKKMIQYIQYITDTLLTYYGIEPHFKVEQPFAYMDLIALPKRDNFFEKRVTEYQQVENTGVEYDEDLDF